MFPLSLLNWFEFGALMTSLIYFSKIRHSVLRYFAPFLFFILSIELTGRFIRKVLHQPNSWLYNVSIPLEFMFYIYLLVKGLNKKKQHVLKWLVIFYPGLSFLNVLRQGLLSFNTYNILIGDFFIILLSCILFYEVFMDDTIENPVRIPMFWITTGLLFFTAGEFFYNLFFRLLDLNGLNDTRNLFEAINNNLNFVLYGFISIGIIWEAKNMNSC